MAVYQCITRFVDSSCALCVQVLLKNMSEKFKIFPELANTLLQSGELGMASLTSIGPNQL